MFPFLDREFFFQQRFGAELSFFVGETEYVAAGDDLLDNDRVGHGPWDGKGDTGSLSRSALNDKLVFLAI